MNNKLPITGIIHTKNAAVDIVDAIDSLNFCSEVIVADMASTDKTASLATVQGARVVAVPDCDYADPVRNQVLAQATQPWIFVLDADERVSVGLQRQIPLLINDNTADAYAINRKNIIFGKWLQHTGWWPDTQVRLFRKGKVAWPEAIHSQPVITGKLQKLPIDADVAIEHNNYRSIDAFIARLNRYTTIEVSRQPQLAPESVISQVISEFCSRAIAQNGWRDGRAGIAASMLQSFYAAVTVLKVWEMNRSSADEATQLLTFKNSLESARAELAYWSATYQLQHASGLHRIWFRLRRKYRF